MKMSSAILCLVLSLCVCVCHATPTVTEDQLRSLIHPLFDSPTGSPNAPSEAPPLFASLAAVSPLDPFAIQKLLAAAGPSGTDQQSPQSTDQQMAQLNLAGSLTNIIKTALDSLRPQTQTETASPTPAATLDPIFGNPATGSGSSPLFPSININDILKAYGGQAQPPPFVPPSSPRPTNNNMFNPLSVFGGANGGGPFGMLMPGMMMKMMKEFF